MEKAKPLSTLFDNHSQYSLPSYQRGYAWEKSHIEDFLSDLEHVNNRISEHFFGFTLLAPPTSISDKTIKIIDGQQRITTSILFLICARNFFYEHKDNFTLAAKYFKKLEKIIYVPPINSDPNLNKPRLTLSKPNKAFFLKILRQRLTTNLPHSNVTRNDSNVRLDYAYRTMCSWIKKQPCLDGITDKPDLDMDSKIELISNFVDTLTDKFVIYPYICETESEAYRIFNLVNNRGTKLSQSDLIKSFLFGKLPSSGVSPDDLESYDDDWDNMRHYVTSKTTSEYDLDRYLYHHLRAFYGSYFISDDASTSNRLNQKYMYDLYTDLVDKYKIKPQEIIKSLLEWSHKLNHIRNPNESIFLRKDNVIHYLKKIRSVGAVFVYPVILAGYAKLWLSKEYKEFERLVMLCFKYHIRMKAIGTSISLGEYQETMYMIMNRVNSGDSIKEIIQDIIDNPEMYPLDDRIKANLLDYRLKNSQLAISLLEEIESVYSTTRSPYNVSIEHVMPKNFESWKEYIIKTNDNVTTPDQAKELHKQHYTLLGNLTLLPADINTSISNSSFEVKKIEYAKHKTIRMTELISHIPVWNAEAIIDRQKELVKDLVIAIKLENIINNQKSS